MKWQKANIKIKPELGPEFRRLLFSFSFLHFNIFILRFLCQTYLHESSPTCFYFTQLHLFIPFDSDNYLGAIQSHLVSCFSYFILLHSLQFYSTIVMTTSDKYISAITIKYSRVKIQLQKSQMKITIAGTRARVPALFIYFAFEFYNCENNSVAWNNCE